MKKIFTLMLTLAVALFAGVSCTNDQGAQSGKAVKVTVSGAPEANLPATAGEFTLNYAITNATLTGVLEVTTEAAWVHVGEIGADSVPFTYDVNTDAPGSAPREAVISFAYTDADVVTVTVKQDSAAPVFTVEFSDVSTNSAIATLKTTNQEMDWLCIFATTSQIAQVGTPSEYINAQCESAKDMGMPYLGMMQSVYMGGGAMGKGDAADPIYCQMPWSAEAGDELYMFVLGYNVDADMENWEYDRSTLATAPHIWKVPFLPAPVLTVATEQTVTAAAGSVVLDVTLENAIEGAYVKPSCDDTWVVPTYDAETGKLTLTYEANTAALARQTTIYVDYMKKTFWGEGPDDWYEESLVQTVQLVLTQEKDANAQIVTFDIQVVETHFNSIVVNVTPSDENAYYALNTVAANDWDGNPVTIDWLQQVSQASITEENVFKGTLTNHAIKMSPNQYQWSGYDYHVYAFAVNDTKDAPAGEASHVLTKVDASDTPALALNGGGLVWNETEGRYDLTVSKAGTYTFNYEVTNPVDGASVQLNGTKIDDSYNLVENDDVPTIDATAKTISLVLNGYPADWSKTFAPYVNIYFNYTNADNDAWGVQAQIKVVWVEPAGPTIITSVADLKAGDYYVAGKLATYTSGSNSYDWTNYPYHFWTGSVSAQGNTTSNSDLLTVNGNELMELDPNMSDLDAAKGNPGVITLVAVEGKENTYYVKSGEQYLYSAVSATNRRMQLGDTPTEWVFSDHDKGGINLASNDVYLATAGATYNMIRSYKVSSAASSHQHGLVFFVK